MGDSNNRGVVLQNGDTYQNWSRLIGKRQRQYIKRAVEGGYCHLADEAEHDKLCQWAIALGHIIPMKFTNPSNDQEYRPGFKVNANNEATALYYESVFEGEDRDQKQYFLWVREIEFIHFEPSTGASTLLRAPREDDR